MSHARNTGSMLASLRCTATTRSGVPCQAPALRGKVRCRMHGGAKRSGAPCGNRNACKHGLFTKDGIAERKQIRALLKETQAFLLTLK